MQRKIRELLQDVFRLYRAHWRAVMLASLFVYAPFAGLSMLGHVGDTTAVSPLAQQVTEGSARPLMALWARALQHALIPLATDAILLPLQLVAIVWLVISPVTGEIAHEAVRGRIGQWLRRLYSGPRVLLAEGSLCFLFGLPFFAAGIPLALGFLLQFGRGLPDPQSLLADPTPFLLKISASLTCATLSFVTCLAVLLAAASALVFDPKIGVRVILARGWEVMCAQRFRLVGLVFLFWTLWLATRALDHTGTSLRGVGVDPLTKLAGDALRLLLLPIPVLGSILAYRQTQPASVTLSVAAPATQTT